MNRAIIAVAAVLFVWAANAGIAAGKVIYVDGGAGGANNGTCWADAYVFLQDGLADANESEKPVEVRVGQGIYRPDRSAAEPNGTGDTWAAFRLINGVVLRGGYAGVGQADPNARDINLYETILSGDLKGDDANVANPEDLLWEVTRSDNSQRVVEAWDTDGSAGLDGFTVTAGNNPAVCKSGPCAGAGGLRNLRASPTIERCTFTANAAGAGGGICNYEESNPSIINCIFTGNYAGNGGAVYGGSGLISHCIFNSNAGYGGGALWACDGQISNCIFAGNTAHGAGALGGSEALIIDSMFIGNKADQGGALSGCHGEITNCVFKENEAAVGGVLYASENSPILKNCTFFANSSPSGDAIACDSRFQMWPSNIAVTNCIFWDGGNEIWNNDGSTITVSYSDVRGGQIEVYDPLEGMVWGEGIIDAHPLFADPNNGHYHLKSQGGRYDANNSTWVFDDVTSPCIDTGDPMSPIGSEPFPNGGISNMGAYGRTVEASKSYFGEPPCETIVAGDVNGDCTVDFLDFRLMALHWLEQR